jgi:hypothetical protein
MKIPAPMIPPITAIVVPNSPSWRASPLSFCGCLLGFSLIVIEAGWLLPHASSLEVHPGRRVLYHSGIRAQSWTAQIIVWQRAMI